MKPFAMDCAENARWFAVWYGYKDRFTQRTLGRLEGFSISSLDEDIAVWEREGVENECRFLGGEYRARHGL